MFVISPRSIRRAALLTLLILPLTQINLAQKLAPAAHPGFDVSNLDRTCKPCDDFYQFADGGWAAKNPIPAAYPRWGTFNQLADQNNEKLRSILEDAAKNTKAPKGSIDQMIGDFYASGMDTAKIEQEGVKPLEPELDRIAAVHDVPSLQAEVARLQGRGARVMFNFGSAQDFKNSTQVIGQASQGGLGLPDRDYYTKDDDKSKQIRAEYVKHVAKMFELLGDDASKAGAEAKTVMAIETKLAEASITRVQRRDPEANYHKMGLAELKDLTPNFSWTAYFSDLDFPAIKSVNIGQPGFFKAFDKELTATLIADWQTYLRWHVMSSAAPYLSSKFEEEDFNFGGKVLTGTKEMLPRWKRVVAATDGALGEALGQRYVEKYFTAAAKARALAMVNNLIAALRDDLSTLSWMGEATRKQALTKLNAFAKKIGYPSTWRNYTALKVDRGSYVNNTMQANLFEFNRNLGQIDKPVDRTEWGMSPPTVNAYYNPLMNEIVFPAGILQPPFYDPQADDAINYGGMGAVIGHEMTHGFDDQGAKFDADGNLKNWWTPEDLKNFQQRSQCVIDQFDSYVVEGSICENGKLVVGESIADLGGLTIAYAALQRSMRGKPRPKEIDGFTPEQRFFLGWAQVWAGNTRPEFARLLVTVDPHPLGQFRTIGPLSNMPQFAKAFDCKEGDKMVRAVSQRCQIW